MAIRPLNQLYDGAVTPAKLADLAVTPAKLNINPSTEQVTLVLDTGKTFAPNSTVTKYSFMVNHTASLAAYVGADEAPAATITQQGPSAADAAKVVDIFGANLGCLIADAAGNHVTLDFGTSAERVAFCDIQSTSGGTWKWQYSVSDGVTYVDIAAALAAGGYRLAATTFRYLRVFRSGAGGNCVVEEIGAALSSRAAIVTATGNTATFSHTPVYGLLAFAETGTPTVTCLQY